MGKKVVWLVVVSLLCSPLISLGAFAHTTEVKETSSLVLLQDTEHRFLPEASGDSQIDIVSPEAGYLYLFKLRPFKLPIASALGLNYAVVVGRSLTIDTTSSEIHHAKFVAKRMVAGWETIRWDYQTIDGLAMDFGLTSGLYNITVYAYDSENQELDRDSITVCYLKVGGQDFGVWVNTKYNGGETVSTPLQLGVTDFASMLNTGESKQFRVSMQQEDDTTVDLRFTRTKILNNTEKVVETKCSIETDCDTTKEYEISVEIRFPFVMLDGGQPSQSDNPFFSTKIGYISSAAPGGGANKVNTTVYVGRETINDPRVFRMTVKPNNVEEGSQLTFFTSFLTVNSTGDEIFQRMFSIDFEPATELTITSIPREAKISYEFGRSAGVPTTISLRVEGGVLDDIVQRFKISPLPSYMTFDLTLLGSREFLYESDTSYDVMYALDSEQNGNLVTFEVVDLPQKIHATWGLALGDVGDLAASSFAELDMSQDVERLALYFFGNERPFISLENFPRKLRFENSIDVAEGTGNLTLMRGLDEVRQMNVTIEHDEMLVTKSFELKNNYVRILWDIDLVNGNGLIDISRDSDTMMTFATSITYRDWIFTKELELMNNHMQLSWSINREQRTGEIIFLRAAEGGSPTLSFSISHDGWVLTDSLELKNDYLKVYWDLPTEENTHAEVGLITSGEQMFHNEISVVDNTVELLRIGVTLQTEDHFVLSWDYVNGHIENFDWSGKLLRLSGVDIAVNLVGDIFTINADFTVGASGSVELQFNKDVAVTFLDTESQQFKVYGDVSFYANKKLQVSWELGESGYFTVYTFGEPLGDEFNLEFGYDPLQTGTYKYGFRLTGENFIEITRTVQWYSENGHLVRIWVLGDEPLPGDWTLSLLWNYEWYTVPWP